MDPPLGQCGQNEAINTLHVLTCDRSCALYGHVRWDQIRRSEHLVSAMTYASAVCLLHSHFIHGGRNVLLVHFMITQLGRLGRAVGLSALRDNTKTFFGVIDDAWGIASVTKSDSVTWMRANFLYAFATMLSRNLNFWDERDVSRLRILADDVRKLSAFDFRNPNIQALAGGGSQAARSLTLELEEHMNSGRRSGKLTRRVEGSGRVDQPVVEMLHRIGGGQ